MEKIKHKSVSYIYYMYLCNQNYQEINKLVETIVKGIQEKKGSNITIVDLREIDGSIANYFVICQGSSPNQIEAISDSIAETTRIEAGEKPINTIGLGNSEWVAMDYSDVLVHIFQPETRSFYNLEELWQDAKLTNIPDLE